jgi:hypothetical protein
MNIGKTWLAATAVVLGLFLTPGTGLAADKAQVLREQSEKLLKSLVTEAKMKAAVENVNLYRQAGLSYQPSLVVPLQGVIECKDKQQLQVLMGLYNFDANYALLFGRKQAFAKTYELRNNIPGRLNLLGKFKLKRFTSEEIEKILNNPDDTANHGLYAKYVAANLHDMLEAAKTDPEMLDLFVDFGYGTVIEGLYVACKLSLAAGTGEKLVALFNDQAARLDMLWQGVAAFAADPELDALAERPQRESIIKPVIEILKTKKGNLAEADVKKILSIVEPERNKAAVKCK